MQAAQVDDGCLEVACALDTVDVALNEACKLVITAGQGDDTLVSEWGARTCSPDELTLQESWPG